MIRGRIMMKFERNVSPVAVTAASMLMLMLILRRRRRAPA